MVTISAIAQRVLDENYYTVSDFYSLTRVEYMIDNAIDTINLRAGTSIADLAGSAEAKTLTGTEDEILVVKELTSLLLRAVKDRGPNFAISGVSASVVLNDPNYTYYTKAVKEDIRRLRALPIVVKNEPVPT